MKKRNRVILFILIYIITFIFSFFITMKIVGSAPQKLLKVKWDDTVGKIYEDLDYENDNNNKYDLYIPTDIDKNKEQYLILYIHGGSFNSGKKEDGDLWSKYYASKGYITATMDYTLQNHGIKADLNMINKEVENCVKAIKEYTEKNGIKISSMAVSGVSAGGTIAMNFAYKNNSVIPVKFVFQLAAPTLFEPDEWDLLKKVDHIKTDEDFLTMMTGINITSKMLGTGEYKKYVNEISPAKLVNDNTIPTLIGYGLKDHSVSLTQKFYLIESLKKYDIEYDYIEFPNSNHGMYSDNDKMKLFLDKSLDYCNKYFE